MSILGIFNAKPEFGRVTNCAKAVGRFNQALARHAPAKNAEPSDITGPLDDTGLQAGAGCGSRRGISGAASPDDDEVVVHATRSEALDDAVASLSEGLIYRPFRSEQRRLPLPGGKAEECVCLPWRHPTDNLANNLLLYVRITFDIAQVCRPQRLGAFGDLPLDAAFTGASESFDAPERGRERSARAPWKAQAARVLSGVRSCEQRRNIAPDH